MLLESIMFVPLWQNVCTSLTSLLSKGFLLKALLLPPFLGSPITVASFHFWPLVEIWWIKFWPTTSTMSWLFFFNWVVGCLSPILTQWKAEGDSKVLKSKLVSVATPTSPHYWLVGRSGGSGHARTGTSEECADPTQPGTRLVVNPKMVEQNILRKCFSFNFWQTISVWI